VLYDILHQIDHGVLGHVKSLGEVLLLADVLNGVLSEKLNVPLASHHDRDGSLIHDVFDVGLQLVHGLRDLD
jgi:hypothetical protein